MNWNDEPAQSAESPPASSGPAPAPTGIGGLRRSIVVGTLALGLLALGGVAAVSAADPSVSPAPSATTTAPSATDAPLSTAHPRGNCPKDGTNGGTNGGSDGTTPDASPDASSSDV